MAIRKKEKQLNRPANWKKQINPNTKRMKALMRDVTYSSCSRTFSKTASGESQSISGLSID